MFFYLCGILRYHISFGDPYLGENKYNYLQINTDANFKKMALDKALICKALILLILVGYR
jgi:hypothetical protein